MQIELRPARAQDRPVINNLAMFYSYDVSEYSDHAYYRCRENGLFDGGCNNYFDDEQTDIFALRVEGELAGLAMVSNMGGTPSGPFWMAEFFILRRWRKKGVGTRVAHELFERYQGPWEVAVWPPNTTAVAFWQRAVGAYTEDSVCALEAVARYDGLEMYVHRFDSRSA